MFNDERIAKHDGVVSLFFLLFFLNKRTTKSTFRKKTTGLTPKSYLNNLATNKVNSCSTYQSRSHKND